MRKYLVTAVFILTAFVVFGQDDATLKPDKSLTDKKRAKKSVKEEAKIHEQSQKDMDKQIGEFHKKHYKKVVKRKGKGKIPSSGGGE